MKAALGAMARKDIPACLDLLTPDFKINLAGMPYQQTGHAAWEGNARQIIDAFPDFEIRIDDMFAAGDKVAVRARMSGTHKGPFLGAPATGKRVSYDSYELYRLEGGKVAEEWICSDLVTLMTQIGAISPHQLVLLWLGSFRLWFVAATGVAAGAGLVLLLQALLP
jgi:steroid delta-isomerase-like uncharacterized protein